MTAPNMFLTPEKTFSVGLRWDETAKRFERAEVQDGEPIFDLVTPTRAEVHEHYGALSGMSKPGTLLNYEDVSDVIWGNPARKMRPLAVRVRNVPDFSVPHPAITLGLARIIRQECGLEAQEVPATTDSGEPTTAFQRLPQEGNSASLSGSTSGSSSNPAEGVGTATAAQV